MNRSSQFSSLMIVGAGRQGRNVLDILALHGEQAGFLDDVKAPGEPVGSSSVVGRTERLDDANFVRSHAWIIAIGDNQARERYQVRIAQQGGGFFNAIHPSAHMGHGVSIGEGVDVSGFCTLHSKSRIDDGALIEAGSVIGCDSHMGPFSRTGPNVSLLGGGRIGQRTLLGAGSVVGEDVSLGDDVILGAGGVALNSIPDGAVCYGVPARIHSLKA